MRAALAANGTDAEFKFFEQHLPTAPIAAEALGVELARIAKSIVLFAGKEPVLVLAAGDRRVDRAKVKALTGGAKVRIASAAEVLATTGFVAGGVAPIGLLHPATVLLDQSLERFTDIWAGGGTPEVMLRLAVASLPGVTGGTFADVTE